MVVNWGDGSAPQAFTYPAGTTTFSETHTYLDDNPTGTSSDSYTISATLTDDDSGSDSESTSVTVNNVAPVLVLNAVTSVNENGLATLSGTITDPGTQDTFTLVVNWGDGSAPQTFTYPAGTTTFSETHTYLDDNPTGTSSDSYTISATLTDDDTGSDTKSTSVTVNNVAPVLVLNAVTSVNENGLATLSGTITDPGTQDTFTLVVNWGDGSAPQTFTYPAGTTTFSETHTYLDDNPTGTSSDSYTISATLTDDDTGSDTESTSVTVNNVAPVLVLNPVIAISETGTAILSGTYTDTGTLDTHTINISWGDGSPIQTVLVTGGSFSVSHVYSDDDADDTYTISVTLTDDDSGSDTETANVTVTNLNPTASDDTTSTFEDNPVTVSVLGNDSDPAGPVNDPLVITGVTNGLHGTVTHNGVTVTYSPALNYFGSDSFTYTISDGDGGTSTATVFVTITPENDGPVAVNDVYSTAVNAALNIPSVLGLLSNDIDVDGPPISVSAINGVPANIGVPVVLTKGTVVVQANGSLVYLPNLNATGFDTFTYTVTDGLLSAVGNVTISIVGVNQLPIATTDFVSGSRNATVNFGVLGNDFDPDGNAFTITHLNGVAMTPTTVVTLANGSLSFNNNNGAFNFDYTPNLNFVGFESFSYRITDSNGGVASASVLINVNNTNVAPDAKDDTFSGNKNTVISGNVLTNAPADTDADSDTLSATLASLPSSGTVSLLFNGAFAYTPNTNFVGTDTFTYQASDGRGGTDIATVTINVLAANTAPTVAAQSFSTAENSLAGTVIGTATASDLDGNALTYSLTGTGASNFTINPTTGQITVSNVAVLDFETSPIYNLTLNVNDGTVTSTAALTINMTNVVDEVAPRVTSVRVNSTAWATNFGTSPMVQVSAGPTSAMKCRPARQIKPRRCHGSTSISYKFASAKMLEPVWT